MVPQPEIRTRLWQNVANGGAAAINVHGTLEQQDRTALVTAQTHLRLAQGTSGVLRRPDALARVLLLGGEPQAPEASRTEGCSACSSEAASALRRRGQPETGSESGRSTS